MEFRDLKEQYRRLQPELDAAMQRVAAGSHYIMGPEVKELEAQLAEFVGVRHCISCANGTDALTIALKVWGIGPGDAVFVPDFTFFSSAEVVAAEGATPIFVDVCEDTFNISPADLERAICEVEAAGILKPRVIIAVDLFGQPAEYPAIRRIADRHGLLILEDGAQGFGGAIDGKRACSFGDISTTSFFPAKPLGCYGDGGALFTDCDDWAALADSYRVHGKGIFKYDNVRIGLNSRLDTIQAAILQVKLRAFGSYELRDVNTAAALYTHRLTKIFGEADVSNITSCGGVCEAEVSGEIAAGGTAPRNSATLGTIRGGTACGGVCEADVSGGSTTGCHTPKILPGYYSSWAQYTIRLRDKQQRDNLQAALKTQDIPSMIYYPTPMHAQTAFRNIYGTTNICPTATRLCQTVLSLPLHPYMTESQIDTICQTIAQNL